MASNKNASVSVVPWFNADQFTKVYKYLFSDKITKKKWAIDTISIWETRCRPSLPTAIEATYVLTSAVIQDILWTNKSTLIHHTDLQGIYGSAITRFVSLTVEVNKNKGCASYSIAEVAKSIGIPSFIVDIRNEWCHSTRPSLSVLRLATQAALKYLKEAYWEKEAARVQNYVRPSPDETKLIKLFEDFIKFHEDTLKSVKTRVINAEDGTKKLSPDYVVLLKELQQHLRSNKRLFVKVLTYDGIFIPTDDKFKRSISDQDYVLFDTDYCLEDDDEDDYSDFKNMTDEEMEEYQLEAEQEALEFETRHFPEVPYYHEDLWHPVIELLNKYDAVPLFMEDLLKSQGDRTVVGQKLLLAWIMKILKIHTHQSSQVNSRKLKEIFRFKGIVPNWLSMLHSAVANPCKYILIILPLILKHSVLKNEEVHRIVALTSLKLGLVPIKERLKSYHKLFHSADDLKEALEHQRGGKKEKDQQKKKMRDIKKENIWAPCPDDCHKLWPIGFIVNEVKDTEDEEEEETTVESDRETTKEDSEMCEGNNDDDEEEVEEEEDEIELDESLTEADFEEMMMEIETRETALIQISE